jgi:hypothetical protein
MTTTFRPASRAHNPAASPGAILGGAEFQFGASMATWGIGRLTGNARVAEVGAHLLRAQIVSQTVTHSIKAVVKRTRPDGSTQNSFPSGHTSVSFASATVLQREFGWKVGIPAYAVASYIGMSRVAGQRHFARTSSLCRDRRDGRTRVHHRHAGNRFSCTSAGKGGGAVSFVGRQGQPSEQFDGTAVAPARRQQRARPPSSASGPSSATLTIVH